MLTQHFWNQYFREYDSLNELIPYQELMKGFVEKIEANNMVRGGKILDAGSGTGNLSIILKKKGYVVYSLDNSQAGQDRHKSKDQNANLILSDLSKKLPFQDHFFDAIVSNNTLYTIPLQHWDTIFLELHRVLKKGGILIISNPCISFKPILIYTVHIKESIKKCGLLKTMQRVIELILPTMRIFYYNLLIQKENQQGTYHFVTKGEQSTILEKKGFVVIEEMPSYAENAFMAIGKKHSI